MRTSRRPKSMLRQSYAPTDFYFGPENHRQTYNYGSVKEATFRNAEKLYTHIHLEGAVASWYMCQDLMHRANMSKSGSPALDRLQLELKTLFNMLTATLSNSFYDYIPLACWGEARHAYGKAHAFLEECVPSDSRTGAVKTAVYYDPNLFMERLSELFNDHTWTSTSYGGTAWGSCADSWLKHRVLNEVAWVDHVIDCAHNNGPVFNKGMIFQWNGNYWYDMLDDKQKGSLYKIKRKGRGLQKKYCFHQRLGSLFARAKDLKLVPPSSYLPAINLLPIKEYDPVLWGTAKVGDITMRVEHTICRSCELIKSKCKCPICGMCGTMGCTQHNYCEYCGDWGTCHPDKHIWCEECGEYECTGDHEPEPEEEEEEVIGCGIEDSEA